MSPTLFDRLRPSASHWLAVFGLLCSLLLCSLTSNAETAPAKLTPVEALANNLRDIDKRLSQGDYQEQQLKTWSEKISNDRIGATDCISNIEPQLARSKADLSSLGTAVKNEAADVVRKRREIAQLIANQERQLSECRVLSLRSDELTQRVNELYKTALAERLFAKGPGLSAVLLDNWHDVSNLSSATLSFVNEHAGLDNLSTIEWLWLAALIAVSAGLGLLLRKQRRPQVAAIAINTEGSINVSASLLAAALHYAPMLFASFTASTYIYLLSYDIRPVPFINVMLYGLPVYLLALLAIHVVLAPRAPCRGLIVADSKQARAMARRLKVLVLLTYIGYLLFSTLFSQHLPDTVYLLARGIYAALLFLNMIWALWLFAKMRKQDSLRWLGLLMAMVLFVSLAAEWSGYRNLALSLVRVIFGSLLAFGVASLLARMFRELYDALEQSASNHSQRLRNLLGVASGQRIPGLIWLRLTTNVLLWLLFGYAMLRIWQISSAWIQQLENWLLRGFVLGEIQIVPLRILLAIGLFAVLVTLARWVQTRLERHWLQYARLDHGARDAVVTITGYVLIMIAAVTGLSVAGFDFRNLAIIAGALSVGIGFGLQNIVNNFVSGLILLFERPLRPGDWVVVGTTEGYVKKINMRSTQIQTFDRADVIVPNSELISQQVTNWMLHDTRGRVRVPIGVAYGSDTQKVKLLLEKVAAEHPSVVTDGSSNPPKVLFLKFGDSSLDFELRCFVRNVDDRLQVISDLNFAIDAAFRAAGVEIPFPQRDLHVRSWPPGYLPPTADAT